MTQFNQAAVSGRDSCAQNKGQPRNRASQSTRSYSNVTRYPFIGIDGLLSRLDGVKSTGSNRWIAKSPTRDERTASLSIKHADDGSILLHDFGGADFFDIVAALGLQPIELIPEHLRHTRDTAPNTRRAPPIPWADAYQAIAFQSNIVLVCAEDVTQGRALDDTALNQLANAVAVIENAVRVCRGGVA